MRQIRRTPKASDLCAHFLLQVPTPHSVLLTNLIGPPGLLLHAATCLACGKAALPPANFAEGSSNDDGGVNADGRKPEA